MLIVVSLSQRSPAPAPRSQVLVDGDAERRVAGEFNVLAHGPAVRRVLGHDAGRGAMGRLVSCRCRSSSQGAHPLLEHAMSTSSRVGASELKSRIEDSKRSKMDTSRDGRDSVRTPRLHAVGSFDGVSARYCGNPQRTRFVARVLAQGDLSRAARPHASSSETHTFGGLGRGISYRSPAGIGRRQAARSKTPASHLEGCRSSEPLRARRSEARAARSRRTTAAASEQLGTVAAAY